MVDDVVFVFTINLKRLFLFLKFIKEFQVSEFRCFLTEQSELLFWDPTNTEKLSIN